MIPPAGFKSEVYPLRHRLLYSAGLSTVDGNNNTAFFTFIRHTNDVIAGTPGSIVVNPHHASYVEDAGPACCKMSIIDKLSMSLRFNRTEYCDTSHHHSGTSTNEIFVGDSIDTIKLLWRPIFFSFNEKLSASDDNTSTTVEAILALTSDTTFEDVVPLTATKLNTTGVSDLSQPVSSVNIAEVFGDYNMTTNTTMEAHTFDEQQFQDAMRRYTNRGALKSMVGRTRHATLTPARPYINYYIDKFVPKSVRRIMPYSFMGIQVHVPLDSEITQAYSASTHTASVPHIGVKCIVNYHEWNADHYQEMSGTPP